jgi:NADH:ubiquinone oxidoreductase subunit F (NADH-binding)/(2Fe-2S) ferredoxin
MKAVFAAEIERLGMENVEIKRTGCHGFCQRAPVIIVQPEGVFYAQGQLKDASRIVRDHLQNQKPVQRLLYKHPETKKRISNYMEIPFYQKQMRNVVLRNCGVIDPEVIEEYLDSGGYQALSKVVSEMEPEQVIAAIEASGLRGRGGAGFSTGRKWRFCFEASGDEKYIICNADEGDPGAFMDRSVLEADPHAVLEGMAIAGYAIGARKGYIYVRAEYPLAVKRIRIAIQQAQAKGILGKSIFGSEFSFDLKIKEGAGAFVCGEETALIASIEGRTGRPRPRPPYPAISGLWGKPTIINNVKTLASVPLIMNRGADWFASMGTESCKGTAVFALTGNIENVGLVEVEMGTTLREIIYDIGGGIQKGRPFKAVQTGGPSGGCLPASFLDYPVDFETLAKAGSIMGSGGMVVMDDRTCMVDIARYFLDFAEKESCGECVPCRLGTKQLHDILEGICAGNGRPEDIELLEELSKGIAAGSLCGLGQTAPNPVITTLRYFREEYEAHIFEKRCPAGVCKELISYDINNDLCVGCMLCAKNCGSGAITGEFRGPHYIDQEICSKCGVCYDVCPPKANAVEIISPAMTAPHLVDLALEEIA